jgi:FlaA1/EpsC-like NDP-sugar epimerase
MDPWQKFRPAPDTFSFGAEFADTYRGQTILITGAGGSIGSALTKALHHAEAAALLLLDSSERALFEIATSIPKTAPCESILGTVNNPRLMDEIFTRFHPQIIFHAAAFKHVALLEHNPFAAIENNVLGTHTLLQAARHHNATSFLLLSTDKAVHPHSIMGVSKRIAELLTVSLSSPTFRANALRLGNVIGTTGSVLPLFETQIARGLPVTITHPDAARYFFSPAEAVRALLTAAATPCHGMILLPDFGQPLKITDLARFLHAPAITYTGLQPGEKLTETFLGPNETKTETAGPLTAVQTPKLTAHQLHQAITQITAYLTNANRPQLLRTLCHLVPDYTPSRLQP